MYSRQWRLQQSLTELTERLANIERGKGDEIHSTKIYHVYNQGAEGGIGFRSTGERLAHELEEITSESRRSTLRKHYTPGDYLKYAGEEGYNSLGRNRRSLSASALGRETAEQQRARYHSGASYISRTSALDRQGTDTYSKKYNYRSRSDVGSPRRYASQTLLDGARPGPTTPHSRRDALHSLQRELDSLSRSPDATRVGGYSSDTGYLDSSRRTRTAAAAGGYSSYDYDSYQSTANRSDYKSSGATAAKGTTVNIGGSSAAQSGSSAAAGSASKTSSHAQQEQQLEGSQEHQIHQQQASQSGQQQQKEAQSSHYWAEDLIDIVHEPMGQTLDRMRRFSNSLSNVDKDDAAKDDFEEKYHRTYKEEHSRSGGPR